MTARTHDKSFSYWTQIDLSNLLKFLPIFKSFVINEPPKNGIIMGISARIKNEKEIPVASTFSHYEINVSEEKMSQWPKGVTIFRKILHKFPAREITTE